MKRWNQKVLFILAACLITGLPACGKKASGSAEQKKQTASQKQQSGDQTTTSLPESGTENKKEKTKQNTDQNVQETAYVKTGTSVYQDFTLDNVLHSEEEGDIHYNLYVPESYDGTTPYALYLTLPGYEGLYFQGVGVNLKSEAFAFTAQAYDEKMIVVAPQLEDWGDTSAHKTIALTEYFLEHYNIDRQKVYINGYSGGGETLSLVLDKRPELYTAALMCSSKWDGGYDTITNAKVPVYFVIGDSDEYYGADPFRSAYREIRKRYEDAKLSETEIADLVQLDVKPASYFQAGGVSNQHGGGAALFAKDENIMGWLFGKHSEKETEEIKMQNEQTVRRGGSSADTKQTPADFPDAYYYGSGRMSDATYRLMYQKMPEPAENDTVLHTDPDLSGIQVLYLWEKDRVPAQTRYEENTSGNYFDPPDFRPYMTAIPVREGVKPKGAVVLLAGGAFAFRGNYTDSLPTAAKLRELGFLTFIVDYRLHPYTQEEGALDVARAVRYIRKHADVYGIDPNAIAVMGYSAGGIQAGEFFLHYDEEVNGSALDASYEPDELDQVPAHASAAGMIYSFYGRLSVASKDKEDLKQGNLPPTFYVYGTRDPFFRQFEAQYELMKEIGTPLRRIVLLDWPHGFGGDGGWIQDYADWLEQIFSEAK